MADTPNQALNPTNFQATVVWLGVVRNAEPDLTADIVTRLDLSFGGDKGERHGGLTALSDVRVLAQYPRGTQISNVRQLSILSEEELNEIAHGMGVDHIDPASVGASMVVRGIPNWTHIPPSSRLQTHRGGTTLVIDMENRPCVYPGLEIEKQHPGKGSKWKAAAENKRGVTAWVQREGPISLGDSLTLHVPDQPQWPHLESVLSDPVRSRLESSAGRLLATQHQTASNGQMVILLSFGLLMAAFYLY